MVALAAAGCTAQCGFMHPLPRDPYFAALVEILDAAALEIIANGTLNQRFRASQKALAIGKALATGIEASINDIHRCVIRPDQPACFTLIYHSTNRRTCRSV